MTKATESQSLHLICNAHLDPVWLWEWEEGAAEAVSTFRIAADFIEEWDGFIFNHNEAILYRWVEEYEPTLFKRIQKLVKAGRWHIMGGWYLQPDCNMPSGESFVRQALLGRTYFAEKFGVRPTTAINFDPFGHTRGLVQILAKAGFDSYLICRPSTSECPLPEKTILWEGYDGSQVMVHRSDSGYNTGKGKAKDKLNQVLAHNKDIVHPVLWGIGNHGGGPSRIDLEDLTRMMKEHPEQKIIHSTPEAFFKEAKKRIKTMPVHKKDINPFSVGCYTSQVRIKQTHRRLENELYSTEKMLSHAWAGLGLDYPANDLREAAYDLATGEFHDILPGSSIQPVEEMSLRVMNHGVEILSRLKARAFFKLAEGQPVARDGEIPVLAYNPHPYPVEGIFEVEFQLEDQNWTETFTDVTVMDSKRKDLPTQIEKEQSSLPLDWRKHVVFRATLQPGSMNRFDCRLNRIPKRIRWTLDEQKGAYVIKTKELDVAISTTTGLIERYQVDGKDALLPNAALPLVIQDFCDPWGMTVCEFKNVCGLFTLLSPEAGSKFSGLTKSIPSVRVIEQGDVRTVIEAVFGYDNSFLCQRYFIPNKGTAIEIETRVFWNEKDKMIKLAFPTPDKKSIYHGQVAYGRDELLSNGKEAVAQKWTAAVSKTNNQALTVLNQGTYGSSFENGEIRLTLLRSAGYSCHPIGERPILPTDQFVARIDQGERLFRIKLDAGSIKSRLDAVEGEALAFNEKPMVLSFFPSGHGKKAHAFIEVSDSRVSVTAVKKAEKGNALIVRLFEPTGVPRKATLSLPVLGIKKAVSLGKFEIKTLRVDLRKRTITEVDILEGV